MNRLELSRPPYTITVEWNTGTVEEALRILEQVGTVPTETKRAKDAVYLLSGSDPDAALALWGTILSAEHLNAPLSMAEATQVIREAQRRILSPPAPLSPTSDEPGRATPESHRSPSLGEGVVADGDGSGNISTGGASSPSVPLPAQAPPVVPLDVAVTLAAHIPTDDETKAVLKRYVLDLFDAMWQIDVWGPDSLVDALDGPVSKLDGMKKADMVSFARAWAKRAQADLVADAPGGSR